MTYENNCGQCGAKDYCSGKTPELPIPYRRFDRNEALDGYLRYFGSETDGALKSIRENEEKWVEVLRERRKMLMGEQNGEEPSRRLLAIETIRSFQLPVYSYKNDLLDQKTCPGKKLLASAANDAYAHGISQVLDFAMLADKLEEERKSKGDDTGLPASVLERDQTGFSFIEKYIDCFKRRCRAPLRDRHFRYTLELAGAEAGYKYYKEFYRIAGKSYPGSSSYSDKYVASLAYKPLLRISELKRAA